MRASLGTKHEPGGGARPPGCHNTRVRFARRNAAAIGLVALLLAPGCGGDEADPDAAAEAGEPSVRQRRARELALLHERRARRDARLSLEQVEPPSAEQLIAEAQEIASLEAELARAMTGEEPLRERAASDEPLRRRFEPGAFPQLLEPDEELRADAVFEADPDADIEMLVIAIQDESSLVREAAAEQLGDSEQELALDALIGALQDDDAEVALATISALEWRDDPRAIPALRVAIEERSESEVREAAQDAIDWLDPD